MCRQNVLATQAFRRSDDPHDGVDPRQLLKHLEAAADDQSAAGGAVAEDPQEHEAA